MNWINVKDRLPKTHTPILVFAEGLISISDRIECEFDINTWKIGSLKITHWMPLPKPPET